MGVPLIERPGISKRPRMEHRQFTTLTHAHQLLLKKYLEDLLVWLMLFQGRYCQRAKASLRQKYGHGQVMPTTHERPCLVVHRALFDEGQQAATARETVLRLVSGECCGPRRVECSRVGSWCWGVCHAICDSAVALQKCNCPTVRLSRRV